MVNFSLDNEKCYLVGTTLPNQIRCYMMAPNVRQNTEMAIVKEILLNVTVLDLYALQLILTKNVFTV